MGVRAAGNGGSPAWVAGPCIRASPQPRPLPGRLPCRPAPSGCCGGWPAAGGPGPPPSARRTCRTAWLTGVGVWRGRGWCWALGQQRTARDGAVRNPCNLHIETGEATCLSVLGTPQQGPPSPRLQGDLRTLPAAKVCASLGAAGRSPQLAMEACLLPPPARRRRRCWPAHCSVCLQMMAPPHSYARIDDATAPALLPPGGARAQPSSSPIWQRRRAALRLPTAQTPAGIIGCSSDRRGGRYG